MSSSASQDKTMAKLQRFILNTKRIIAISKKPSRKEYTAMLKICLIGLAIIGGISFVIQLMTSVIDPNA